jgi:hypothetical protein
VSAGRKKKSDPPLWAIASCTNHHSAYRVQEESMAQPANPFEAIQSVMLQNLEKVQTATQSYMDTFEKTMRGVPGAKDDQIATFKAYVERKVAANRDFVEKLLRAKDFQEAFGIQVEFFQSQLRAAAEDAHQIGSKMANSLKAG